MSIQILGTGSYVPERILTNDELSTMVDTSDEWITQRVGVKTRRISVDESAADMGAKAAQRALEAAGMTADQLGLIVGATVSSDAGVVTDGCVTTAKGMGVAFEFGIELVRVLYGEEKAREIADGTMRPFAGCTEIYPIQ